MRLDSNIESKSSNNTYLSESEWVEEWFVSVLQGGLDPISINLYGKTIISSKTMNKLLKN